MRLFFCFLKNFIEFLSVVYVGFDTFCDQYVENFIRNDGNWFPYILWYFTCHVMDWIRPFRFSRWNILDFHFK